MPRKPRKPREPKKPEATPFEEPEKPEGIREEVYAFFRKLFPKRFKK